MLVGYMRISTTDERQSVDLQRDALLAQHPALVSYPQDDGSYKLNVQAFALYMKQVGDWTFVSQAPEGFASAPEDPAKLLGGLDTQYDMGVQAHIQNIPEVFRQLAVEQIKLGMAMARGLRFNRKDVAREAVALGAIVRSAVERVIDQTAPRLAVMNAPDRRRELLGAELRAVRRALRAEFPRALRRLRSASQRGDA